MQRAWIGNLTKEKEDDQGGNKKELVEESLWRQWQSLPGLPV